MRENKVRGRSSPQTAPDAKAVVLPNPVHDDDVIVGVSLSDPGSKPRRVSITTATRPNGVHRDGMIEYPTTRRSIERNNLYAMTTLNETRRRLFDGLNWTAK